MSRNKCFYIGCDNSRKSKPNLSSTNFHWTTKKGSAENEKPIEEEIECLSDDCNSQESECTIVEKWNNKCITCLKVDVQMETLSSLSLLSEFKELFEYLRIEQFRNEISLNSVCSNCVLQMHNMLSFKRQCEESTEKLELFTTARISETVKSSTVFVEVLHKATQTEIEEKISSNSSVQTFLSVEEEPNEIAHNEIEEEFDLEEIDKKCVTCVNCNEKFNNESWLRRHQVLIHGLKNCIQECYHCLKQYFNSYENKLRIHNECYHENICSVCNLKFQTVIHLAKHRLLHTLSDTQEKLPAHFDARKSRRPHGKVACAKCGKFYKSVSLLRSHIRRVHNLNKVKIACKICKRSVYNLNKHLKWHETHKFKQKISVTDMKKKRKNSLRKKKFNFIEPRRLCTYCGKIYTPTSLITHIKSVHLNIKNYECMHCHKMFAAAGIRKKHIEVVHLKLKRYPCDYCDQKFTRKDYAQKHKLKHTKGIISSANIKNTHINAVHLKLKCFPCDYCDKKFRTNYYAERHKLKHTKEKPYKCQCCDKPFRYRENIRRHMKKVHGMI